MKSFNELKNQVYENLSKYPKIEAFFKDSLAERMKIDDGWIENRLVLLLLDTAFFEQSALHTLIESLSSDKENFNILRSKLNPKDQYDQKIRDVLAELNGYYQLKEAGLQRIEALREETGRKKPDFSAELRDRLYLFEVKNMRAPIEVSDLLLVKSEVREHRFPDIYEPIDIWFWLSPNWRDIELGYRETDLEKDVKRWLGENFVRIESAAVPVSLRIDPFNLASRGLTIECNLKKGKNLGACCGLKRGVMVSDPDYQQSILLPFSEKVRRITSTALSQLLEYDENNAYLKYVLLNWQKSAKLEGLVWNGFEDDAHEVVRSADIEVKKRSENSFVKLLNYDTLP